MFIRIKKVKGKEYAYLVENEWKSGSKQKVKGYIGRVYRPELSSQIGFLNFYNLSAEEILKKDVKEIFNDLLKWEIHKHSITEFEINAGSFAVMKSKKNCAVLINDGFLCSYTLKNLFGFRPIEHESDTMRLARCLVEAGIKVPQEIFVGLCEKMFKFE